jgi:penicillin amidase
VIRCIAALSCLAALALPASAHAVTVPGLPALPGTGTLTGILHNPAGGALQTAPTVGGLEQNPTAGTLTFPTFDGFHSVLAFGEGEGTSDQDLALFEANGTVPAADLNQDQMYEGLEQAWPGVTDADLGTYYKDSDFAPEPSPTLLSTLEGSAGGALTGSPPSVETPRAGVTIVRDAPYEVPRIYADTRAEGMWAAGYVTAEDRLFLMDVLRHTAEGTTAELLGPSAVPEDSAQLGVQDELD